MDVQEALTIIDKVSYDFTYATKVLSDSDIGGLIDAARTLKYAYEDLQAAHEHAEWLRLRQSEVYLRG